MKEYKEPELSILVLDYCKQPESFMLLESIKKHVKVEYKVIFCDNGSGEDYALQYLKDGLIDQLIINKDSMGLGLGTRDLFAASQSKYSLYIQNDQYFINDLTQDNFDFLKSLFDKNTLDNRLIKSISLAGFPCGQGIFSERAHMIKTDFYKSLEPLSFGGAGPYHEFEWREGQIQELYKKNNWVHIMHTPIVQDNGVFAIRDMKESGIWVHRTDTKQLWCIEKPKEKNSVYPKLNEAEWGVAIYNEWPDGRIPEIELKDSFDCWSNTTLGRMQNDYIRDLRIRFKEKGKL